MYIASSVVRLLARSLEAAANFFNRLSDLFNGLLPPLLSPAQLTKLVQDNYRASYPNEVDLATTSFEQWRLLEWELGVLERYDIRSGRMLVLGAGWGREAIELARKGLSVVGIDTNFAAVRTARQIAHSAGIPVQFHQADLLALPYAPASFSYAILSSIMYSAIPGMPRRQTWLRNLSRILLPDGLVILSFHIERRPMSRLKTLCRRLNRMLARLPGASPTYQIGDDCVKGHFLHSFQDEDEIRAEFGSAGVVIRELDWKRGFAVLAYAPIPNPTRHVSQPCATGRK